MNNPQLTNAALLVGRIMLAAVFVFGGYGKIGGYSGALAYMASKGVPGALLPLVILVEVLGGLLIVVGYQTRIVAILLAGFSLLAALLFHTGGDMNQTIHFMKNIGLAGGFLALFAAGAGAWSIDGRKKG